MDDLETISKEVKGELGIFRCYLSGKDQERRSGGRSIDCSLDGDICADIVSILMHLVQ